MNVVSCMYIYMCTQYVKLQCAHMIVCKNRTCKNRYHVSQMVVTVYTLCTPPVTCRLHDMYPSIALLLFVFLVPRNSLCSVHLHIICMYTMYFMIREPCGTYLQVWYRVPVNRYSSNIIDTSIHVTKISFSSFIKLKYLDTDPFSRQQRKTTHHLENTNYTNNVCPVQNFPAPPPSLSFHLFTSFFP